MGVHYEDHIKCSRKSSRTFTPLTLSQYNGLLSISNLPLGGHPRTPLPHAVRHIANHSRFSTDDPILTSFLWLLAEVRIQIYRLLLRCDFPIQYGICPVRECLIARIPPHRRPWWKQPRIPRHMLFPTILECCLTINEEGSAVLYGENLFQLECASQVGWLPIFATWAPSRGNFNSITKLRSEYKLWYGCSEQSNILDVMTLLPSLREIEINLWNPCIFGSPWEPWGSFLCAAEEKLRDARKTVLDISIETGLEVRQIPWKGPDSHSSSYRERYFWAYGQQVKRHVKVWENMEVEWHWEELSDDCEPFHRITGTLKVYL